MKLFINKTKIHYHFRHQTLDIITGKPIVLNLSDRHIRRVFIPAKFISSKLFFKFLLKLSRKASLALILLILSSSWSLQALAIKNDRKLNRSDAIILPPSQWGDVISARPILADTRLRKVPIEGVWDPEYGALVQSTNPASYGLNFPTTGANGLYFDLIIRGDADELIWEPVTHEGITVTVSSVDRRSADNQCVIECDDSKVNVIFRVKLKGPEADSQWRNPYPNPIAKPRLPQTFEIVGRDREGSEVTKYGFALQYWFVPRADQRYYPPKGEKLFEKQKHWCPSLGYRMTHIKDLTNAVCIEGLLSYTPCPGGIVSATPSSVLTKYKENKNDRRIGSGLLTEWGYVRYYNGSFPAEWFWAIGPAEDSVYAYDVNLGDGAVSRVWKGAERGIMCVTP